MGRLILIFVFLSFLVLATLIFIISVYHPSNVLIEVVKVLLQLLVIVIFGSLVSFFVQEVGRQRQQDQSLIEFRRMVLKDLVEAYSHTKRARRLLRSNGFSMGSRTVNEISTLNQSAYKEELDEIVDIQLRLEAIGTEITAFSQKFTNSNELISNIRKMDEYLNTLVDEFEERFVRGGEITLEIKSFSALSDFLSNDYLTTKFKTEFVEPYKSGMKSVQRDILDKE